MKPFPEKRRGRPRNKIVDKIAAAYSPRKVPGIKWTFPGPRSRRSHWNTRNLLRALLVLSRHGLVDPDHPWPSVVLYALGTIREERLLVAVARRCIQLRAKDWRAHHLAKYVRSIKALRRTPPHKAR